MKTAEEIFREKCHKHYYKGTSVIDEKRFLEAMEEYKNQFQQQVSVEPVVMQKIADILKVLDDEEYTVSVFSNDKVDDKISESIANTAIIDFKKQLKAELISKFSA